MKLKPCERLRKETFATVDLWFNHKNGKQEFF